MSVYGDGSGGALNVLSGTHSLALNTKHQFSSVNIASGATLSTGSATGSVLYILVNGTFTLNGTIDVSNKVTPGNNTWSTTIDGVTYSSPGVQNGASGSRYAENSNAPQANGFGGGGSGGLSTGASGSTTVTALGGNGGTGGTPAGTGGASVAAFATVSSRNVLAPGISGTNSAGGSGAAEGYVSGTASAAGTSGAGGNAYGENGSNGISDYYGTSGSVFAFGAGGGGAGGIAGKAGVHVVIKAKTIVLNGTIITSGTSGGNGGNGGYSSVNKTLTTVNGGAGGGGGGGGNAGSITLVYSDGITDTASKYMTGGGAGGGGVSPEGYEASDGTNGSNASDVVNQIVDASTIMHSESTGTAEMERANYAAVTSGEAIGRGTYTTVYQALPQKEYEYRIFNADGTYRATLSKEINSRFSYSQAINQAPSELKMSLARSPDNRVVMYDTLRDENNASILDANSDTIYLATEAENAVGADTDIDLNYNVDVYAFYGGYDALLDENGNEILDENSTAILSQYGAPNGIRVYSGYIVDYELTHSENMGVEVVVAPHAAEMSHYVFMDGTSTTVEYNSADPVTMARDAMDNYISQGGIITYDTASMPLSGESSSYDFNLQTTREAIDKTIEFLPSGYYHYVHPGENKQYLLQKSATPDHTFYYEKHIKELKLRKSITQLINKEYVTGGEYDPIGHPGEDLYIYRSDATSISTIRPGLKRYSDSRIKTLEGAEAIAERDLELYSVARYRTSVTITDAVYDIESINLGEMIGFKNFGSFVDNLLLQIVNIDKEDHSVTLDLDMLVPNDTKRLHELKKSLQSQEVRNLPAVPS